MSPSQKPVSQWKLMLIGRSSEIMKRLFVVALAAVSLLVWGITIIGLGILRQEGGSAGVVRSAKASPSSPGILRPPPKRHSVQAVSAGVGEVEPVRQEVVLTTAAKSMRNPFLPDSKVFPSLKTDDVVTDPTPGGAVAADRAKEASQEEIEAIRQLVESMMLISTATDRASKEAVIDGWMVKINDKIRFKVNNRAESLNIVDIRDGSVVLSALGRDFVLTVPTLEATLLGGKTPMAMIDGQGYRAGDRLKKVVVREKLGPTAVETIVQVKEIRNQSVILRVGGAGFELTMRGVRGLREAETNDGQRSIGAVRATVEKE